MADRNITGRDDPILATALWYALKYIQSLPAELQEWSNEQDMKTILMTRYRGFVESRIMQAKATAKLQRERPLEKPANVSATEFAGFQEAMRRHMLPPDLVDERGHPYFVGERDDRLGRSGLN